MVCIGKYVGLLCLILFLVLLMLNLNKCLSCSLILNDEILYRKHSFDNLLCCYGLDYPNLYSTGFLFRLSVLCCPCEYLIPNAHPCQYS